MSYLILVRHGLSEYNKKGLWTGWDNPPLAPEGITEAQEAGNHLNDIEIDYAYSSALLRARQTLDEILKVTNQHPPIVENKALNERNYGIYTGKNKWQVQKEVGDQEFLLIRRSWDHFIPEGESLKQVYQREIPYFQTEIEPKLKEGKNVLISTSGNAIRALVKYLEDIPDSDVSSLEIGTGEVYVYTMNTQAKVEKKEIRALNANKGKV